MHEKGELDLIYQAINSTFYGFDTAVYRFFSSIQSIPLNKFAWFMTFFGGDTFFYILLAAAIVLCVPKKTRKYGMSIVLGMGIAWLVTNLGIKLIIQRPRPFVTLRDDPFWTFYEHAHQFAAQGTSHQPSYEPSFSFPSGHTTNSFSYTTAFILAGCTSYKTGSTTKHRKWQWWLVWVPFFVGMSRIYIFVHYPSDVFFGMFNGILWGTIGFLLANAICEAIDDHEAKKKALSFTSDHSVISFGSSKKNKKDNPYDDPTMVKIGANTKMAYENYMAEKRKYEEEENSEAEEPKE